MPQKQNVDKSENKWTSEMASSCSFPIFNCLFKRQGDGYAAGPITIT